MGGWECDTQKHNPVRHVSSGDRQTDLGQDLAVSQVVVAPERWLTSKMYVCWGRGVVLGFFSPLQVFRMFLLFSNQRKSLFLIFGAEGEGVRF